ncbi:MAG TPA: sulfatase-like hydrolase/transferase, partial [Actinomycetota bacterium]|nr:sulfatase-like hydrolase/transferase [Actinomycetota bacterium]
GYRTFAASANPWITRRMGFGAGFDRFVEGWRASRNPRFSADAAPSGARRRIPRPARAWARRARRAARSVLAREDSGAAASLAAFRSWLDDGARPFFAFFNFMEPHMPYLPPRPFGPGGLGRRLAAARLGGALTNEFVIRYNVGRADLDGAELGLLRQLYAGELAYLDARLAELGALAGEDALVVVVGDHGESLGEHHLLGHNTSLADTLLRVPLLLSGPRDLAGRGEVAGPVSTSLVASTLLGAAGLPHEGPTLLEAPPDGPALAWYESAYAEAAGARAVAEGDLAGDPDARRLLTRRGWAAHRGRHKVVAYSDGTRSVFDVEADPGETRDLLPERPSLAELFDGVAVPFEPPVAAPAGESSVPREELEEIESHLRSLGYL